MTRRWRCPRCGRETTSGRAVAQWCHYDGARKEPLSAIPMLPREERDQLAMYVELHGVPMTSSSGTLTMRHPTETRWLRAADVERLARDYLALRGEQAVDAPLLARVLLADRFRDARIERAVDETALVSCERDVTDGAITLPTATVLSRWADWAARTGPR